MDGGVREVRLQNGRTVLELDPKSRAIVCIQDAVSGVVHLDARQERGKYGRLFRVVTPTPAWASRYADSQEQEPPEVARDDAGLTLRFAGLSAQGGDDTGIMARARIEPSSAPDELLFTLHVENRGAHDINEVIFPWLGGWDGQGGPGRDRLLFGGGASLDPHSLPRASGATYARSRQRAQTLFAYPVVLNAPWVDLSGPSGGISYLNCMPEARNGYISIENLAGYGPGLRLAYGWAHTVVVRPGESWTSPPMGLAVHAGDWHETADRYRAWMDEHLRPAPATRSAGKMIGFQNVFFRGFDGERLRGYEEIPAVAAAGRRHGVNHLCIWDYLTLGNYLPHPELDLTDYDETDRAALSAGIRQARAEGTNVSALINFRHLNPASKRFAAGAASEIKRCYDGTPQTENWSGSAHHGRLFVRHLGPECNIYSPLSSAYQERVMRLTREYLDLGYTSMFFDQPWEMLPDYAFVADGHGPDTTQAAVVELIGRVRELLRQNDAEALMIGEECDVFGAQWIDMWMSWAWSDLSAEPRLACLRYSIPDAMLSWMVDSEPERATLAFALGMYLCICVHGNEGTLDDEPALAEHIANLARLRTATAERTTMARFNDQRGINVEAEEGFRAYSFDSAAGPAVIAAAPTGAATGQVTVDRTAFAAPGDPGRGVAYHLDGSTTQAPGDTRRFALDENEVAVWVL